MIIRLKGEFHLNDERMTQFFHNVSFIHNYLRLAMFYNKLFLNHFHSIKLSVLFKSTQKHL